MRNLLLYHLVSGHGWFTCGLIVIFISSLDFRDVFRNRRIAKRVAHFVLVLAIGLAALTGTPLTIWLVIPLITSTLSYAAFGFARDKDGLRRSLAACAIAFIVLALLLEIPWQIAHPPEETKPEKLYIIADSITAGLGEKVTYPRKVESVSGVQILDFSKAGATAGSALGNQVTRLLDDGTTRAWVLLEIGGNDMLGGTTPEDFRVNLEQLILASRGKPDQLRKVLMFELPITPGSWSFGRAQRQLASQYGVTLIPKRVLAGLLLTEENTVDGIHLSPEGHNRMAELVLPWLGKP